MSCMMIEFLHIDKIQSYSKTIVILKAEIIVVQLVYSVVIVILINLFTQLHLRSAISQLICIIIMHH